MSLWDRQSAYCRFGPLLLHRSLTTVGWCSRRGSQWQGPCVTFSLGSVAVKGLGVIQSRLNSDMFFFFFVTLWLLFCSFTAKVFLSFPLMAIFESSDGPAAWVPCWNMHLSTWWERRQWTFLHSWVLDAALITTPETETWSLSACSCLVLFIFSFPLFVSLFVSLCLKVRLPCIIIAQCLPGTLFFSGRVCPPQSPLSQHPHYFPTSSGLHPAPRPSSSRGSPEAAH